MTPVVIAAALAAPPAASDPPGWSRPAPPVHVAGSTWEVGSQGLSVFLIRTRKGAILIDGGLPGYAPKLLKTLAGIGVRPSDVKLILNTHAHFDHAGDLAELKRLTGATLAAMAPDVPALERGVYPGSEDRHDFDFPPVHVDRVLHDGETVSLGGARLHAVLTAGHTAGCTTWTWTEHDAGRPLTLVLDGSTAVAANRLVGRPQYPGIVADYRRTFARLKAMRADIFLAPHAEQYDLAAKRARAGAGGRNPFVDPSELPRAVAASKADFEAALAKQQASAR